MFHIQAFYTHTNVCTTYTYTHITHIHTHCTHTNTHVTHTHMSHTHTSHTHTHTHTHTQAMYLLPDIVFQLSIASRVFVTQNRSQLVYSDVHPDSESNKLQL